MAKGTVLVDDEGNIIGESEEVVETQESEDGDDASEDGKASGSDDDSDDHDGDSGEESASGDSEDDREALREKRREERKRRRQNHREREDALRREIAARDEVLRAQEERLAAIERRNKGSELAQLDAAIKQAATVYNQSAAMMEQATNAADGKMVRQAVEQMNQAQRRHEELSRIKNAMVQKQRAPQPLDPRLKTHAEAWMSANKWYDPSGKDPDSRIALTIDQGLAEEGLDPVTPQYWEELSRRVKKYLPHRAKTGYNSGTNTKSVVSGSGRNSSSSPGASGYSLSAERVQAIKDAGAWDDPKARSEMIKRYREYDKQHGQG